MLIDLTMTINAEMAGHDDRKLPGHLGTHFDIMDKEFPLDYLKREGIIFDLSRVGDQEIEITDIDLSAVHENMFVGFCTGFLEKEGYGTVTYRKQHPQLSKALIDALLEKQISVIGIDFAGVRRGEEHTITDQYCADHGVFIVENMCNMKAAIGKSNIYTFPLKLTGTTGIPCRVVAENEF